MQTSRTIEPINGFYLFAQALSITKRKTNEDKRMKSI
jgi:hypothetical protein